MMEFFKRNRPELILVTVVALAFFAVQRGVRWLDPAAGVLDLSWFTLLAAGMLKSVCILLIMFLTIGVCFPTINKWIETGGFAESWAAMGHRFKLQAAGAAMALIAGIVTLCVLFG